MTKSAPYRLLAITLIPTALVTVACIRFIDDRVALAFWRFTSSRPLLHNLIREIPSHITTSVLLTTATLWLAYFLLARKRRGNGHSRFIQLAATSTHKEMFQITFCDVKGYETNGYYAKVQQEIKRADNSWREILQNPALLIIPKLLKNTLEYTFPSTTALFATAPVGNIVQTHILYPETTNRTKTFVLFYGKFKNPLVKFLFGKSLLETGAKIVEQDSKAVENLYPREKPKLRLPNEEIMFDAEKLYRNW